MRVREREGGGGRVCVCERESGGRGEDAYSNWYLCDNKVA